MEAALCKNCRKVTKKHPISALRASLKRWEVVKTVLLSSLVLNWREWFKGFSVQRRSKDVMFLSVLYEALATIILILGCYSCRCTESIDDLRMMYEKKQRKILKKQKTYENFRQQLQVLCMFFLQGLGCTFGLCMCACGCMPPPPPIISIRVEIFCDWVMSIPVNVSIVSLYHTVVPVHRPPKELWTHEERSFNEMLLIWSVNWHGS